MSGLMHLPLYEGKAPRALLVEGATRAPVIAKEDVLQVKDIAEIVDEVI